MNSTEWRKFPNPEKGEYICAPFGMGVYQLRNAETGELILFGSGNNIAFRMTSLLPPPLGQGTRNNEAKREYVKKFLSNIEYRTVPCLTESEMKENEKILKSRNNHIFNS
ncbi:MAG TPA: hypothetical protein PKC24_09960 [Cyclobacteriaceae bacterium]|nr:hypothetical protein [Cyclobacteriaceae bacterium]